MANVMVRTGLLVAFLCVGSAVGGCKTDWDCSLNGECVSGSCVCDAAWTTDDCSELDRLPAPVSYCGPACAFHGREEDYKTWTTWGGSVLEVDSPKGKYRMLAAEMANHCGLNDWGSNSRVTQAFADSVEGPFKWDSVAVPPWAHNPEAIIAPDGTHVLYILGTGKPHEHEKNCTTAPGESDGRPVEVDVTHYNITIFSSSSPDGPWSPHSTWLYNLPADSNLRNYNPAPWLWKGNVRLMVHTDRGGKVWTGETVTEAPTWQGPYKGITGDVTHCEFALGHDPTPSCLHIDPSNRVCQEDPYVWVDKRGNTHALFHTGHFGSYTGGHAFSRDGLTWSNISRCYNTTFELQGGGTIVANRRERPKLFINKDGVPTHLFNGIEAKDHGTYTAVQPLNV